jgi:DNA-binding NtrC family response regulator
MILPSVKRSRTDWNLSATRSTKPRLRKKARNSLREKRFDYVLLDLELPLRRGRPASLEAGKNLLRDAIANPLIQRVGFIVVTAFGHDTPDLAVEVMKIGAVDFVRKPYHGLENAIRDFLKRRTNPQPPITNGQPRDSSGGEWNARFYDEISLRWRP